jgi:hypothetical protein
MDSGLGGGVLSGIMLVQLHQGGLDKEGTSAGHGVPGIHSQVEHDLL